MIYVAEFPESIHYSTTKKLNDKWKARGVVMPEEKCSSINHPGIIDFEDGASKLITSTASRYFGGTIEVRTDAKDGELIGTIKVPYIGEWTDWQQQSTDVKKVKELHDLYFIFNGLIGTSGKK